MQGRKMADSMQRGQEHSKWRLPIQAQSSFGIDKWLFGVRDSSLLDWHEKMQLMQRDCVHDQRLASRSLQIQERLVPETAY